MLTPQMIREIYFGRGNKRDVLERFYDLFRYCRYIFGSFVLGKRPNVLIVGSGPSLWRYIESVERECGYVDYVGVHSEQRNLFNTSITIGINAPGIPCDFNIMTDGMFAVFHNRKRMVNYFLLSGSIVFSPSVVVGSFGDKIIQYSVGPIGDTGVYPEGGTGTLTGGMIGSSITTAFSATLLGGFMTGWESNIGLLGVDLTPPHNLSGPLDVAMIDEHFSALLKRYDPNKKKIRNLSSVSCLKSIPLSDPEVFIEGSREVA